jgi:hypothetical protein
MVTFHGGCKDVFAKLTDPPCEKLSSLMVA